MTHSLVFSTDLIAYSSWRVFLGIAIILISVIIGHIIVKNVKFLKNSFIPSSVVAGIIISLINIITRLITGETLLEVLNLVESMELITYHCLGLGFAAIALKVATKDNNTMRKKGDVFNTGLTTVTTYLIQGIFGLIVTVCAFLISSDSLIPEAGLLLPMGYGQGPGQALNFGSLYETYGFGNGISFALTISSVGFIVGAFGGVIYLNSLKKKGLIKEKEEQKEETITLESTRLPDTDGVDKLTITLALIVLAYVLAYLFMFGVTSAIGDKEGLLKDVKSLVIGFNFIFATIFGLLIKAIITKLQAKKIIKTQFLDTEQLNRTSGFFFDLMIVASMASIDFDAFLNVKFIVTLLVLCIGGAIITYLYIKFIAKKLFPHYEHEFFLSMFGMLTGTASTGMVLLREADNDYHTPMSSNLAYQNLPAILFGFPIMIMMTFSKASVAKASICIAILSVYLVILFIILFRSVIFKSRNKHNNIKEN